mgnify:CR=1 FL=1
MKWLLLVVLGFTSSGCALQPACDATTCKLGCCNADGGCEHCYGGAFFWWLIAKDDPGFLVDYLGRMYGYDQQGVDVGLGIQPLEEIFKKRGYGGLYDAFTKLARNLFRNGLIPVPTYRLKARIGEADYRQTRVQIVDGLSMHYIPVTVPGNAKELIIGSLTGGGPKPAQAAWRSPNDSSSPEFRPGSLILRAPPARQAAGNACRTARAERFATSNYNLQPTIGMSSPVCSCSATGTTEIPVKQIRPNPFQPRKVWDGAEIEELASSIREQGLIQPIAVRPRPA